MQEGVGMALIAIANSFKAVAVLAKSVAPLLSSCKLRLPSATTYDHKQILFNPS